MNKNKRLIMISISLLILAYILGMLTVKKRLFPYPQIVNILKNNKIDENTYLKNPQFHDYTSRFKIYETKNANIVMLGDSLTANVYWNELFDYPIINRGIGADITYGYLNRMDSVYSVHPKKVFLNGGTNDIELGYSVEDIFNNYKKIIKILQEHNIKVYMQSTIYTSYNEINVEIEKLNKLLEKFCIKNNIVYINLNIKLSKNSTLLDEYTIDGAHLNEKGYLIWKEEISKYIFDE